jgi:predicted transcriptional regulator
MKMLGITEKELALMAGVSATMIRWVIYGTRTSGRVSKIVATALGYSNWNELVVSIKGFAA